MSKNLMSKRTEQKQPAQPEKPAETASATEAQAAEPGMLRGMTAALLVVVVAVSAAAFIVPRFIGGVPLAVLTGSMEPVYSPGDLVISQAVPPEDIAVNDVVTFQPESGDPTLITHRVIAKTLGADGIASFTTQGDANGTVDDPIMPDQVKGKIVYSLPYLGYVTTALDPGAKAAVATVGGIGLVGYAIFMVVGGARAKLRKTGASA